MDKVTLENYRCFHEEQVARLAPLTLLVGDNSTGKTSFLAMIRALMDIAAFRNPDFKEEPFDLGSFDEIVNHRGGKNGGAKTFGAGFSTTLREKKRGSKPALQKNLDFKFTFGKRGATPILSKRHMAIGKNWVDEAYYEDGLYTLRIGSSRGSWRNKISAEFFGGLGNGYDQRFPLIFALESKPKKFEPIRSSPPITSEDTDQIKRLIYYDLPTERRPFASAPVRSKPRRTYDPSRITPDPEGDYVPMYLANMFFQHKRRWKDLKNQLEKFGRAAGLFDEIFIR